MGRYLLFFSYIGTRYHGMQRQMWQEKLDRKMETIAGVLEQALACLKPQVAPHLKTSSRTDAGVHALSNTAHVDMQPHEDSFITEYCPKIMTHVVNFYLQKNRHDIRVRNILRVSADFHARMNAFGRTYLYKLAKYREPNDNVLNHRFDARAGSPISVFGLQRCGYAAADADMDLFKHGAHILSGTHDYSAFTGNLRAYQNPQKSIQISVQPSGGFMDYLLDDNEQKFDHYDILITGNSFLHKQVRKMVGALHAYSRGKMTEEILRDLVEDPAKHKGNNMFMPAMQSGGLYLVNVHYRAEDLIYDPSRPPWQPRAKEQDDDDDDSDDCS